MAHLEVVQFELASSVVKGSNSMALEGATGESMSALSEAVWLELASGGVNVSNSMPLEGAPGSPS